MSDPKGSIDQTGGTMFFGIRQLRRAADLLEAASSPEDDIVPEAILSFLSACACRGDWPESFRDRAEEIRRRMTAGGPPVSTARILTPSDLLELREAVTQFVADAERQPDPPLIRSVPELHR